MSIFWSRLYLRAHKLCVFNIHEKLTAFSLSLSLRPCLSSILIITYRLSQFLPSQIYQCQKTRVWIRKLIRTFSNFAQLANCYVQNVSLEIEACSEQYKIIKEKKKRTHICMVWVWVCFAFSAVWEKNKIFGIFFLITLNSMYLCIGWIKYK